MSSSPLNGTANTLPPDEKSTTNPPSAVASPRGNPPLRQNSITINTAIAADTAGHGTHGTASDALTPAFTTPIQPTPLVGRWADYWGDPNPQAFGNSGGHNGAVGRSGSKQAGSPSATAAAASGEHHEDINHILTETARQVIESVEQERAKSAASHPESPMAAGVGAAEWGATRATPTQHTMSAAQATTVTIMQPGAAILVPAGGVAYAQDSSGGVYAIPMMQAMPQGVQHANAAAAAAAAANAAGGGVTRSIISHHTSHFTPPPPPPPNFFAALQQEERSDAAVEILTLALNRWIEHVEIWLRHHESERPTVACPVLEQFNSVEVWSNKVQAWYSANFIPRAQRQSARRTAKVNHNQARMAAQHQQQGGGSGDDGLHQGGGGGGDGAQGGQPGGGRGGGDRRGDRGGRGGPRFAPQHQQQQPGSAPLSFGQPPPSAPFSAGAVPPQSFSVSAHHGGPRGGGPAGGRGAGYPPPQQQPMSHQHQPYGPPQPQQGGWGYPPPQQQQAGAAGAPAYAHHHAPQQHHSGLPQAGFGGYAPPHSHHAQHQQPQQRWAGPPPTGAGGFVAPHGAGPAPGAHGSPYLQQPPAVQHSLQPGSGRPFDTRTRMVDE